MKVYALLLFAMTRSIESPNSHWFCWWHVGATGVAGPVGISLAEPSAQTPSSEGAAGKPPQGLELPSPAEYPQAFEDIERASAPKMSDGTTVDSQVDIMHRKRESDVKSVLRQQLRWITSRGVHAVFEQPPFPSELAFRNKQRQYAHNRFVQTMADFDLDGLQNASINYRAAPLPLEEYLKMVNNVRQKRLGVQVEEARATLPDPSVAYTPFHRDIARQKTLEKKFRVHYLTGSGRKFPFFYNAEDNCFWKKVEDGSVACVHKEELTRKPKHDPAITVAVDQTGMYDRIEEAPFPQTPLCADFYLEKATWTYYCVPNFLDLRIPRDYKKMQRYKNLLNKQHFNQWAGEQSQLLDLPVLYRPPRPGGSPQFTGNSDLSSNDVHSLDNSSVEGVLILTPHNFTVAHAPALNAAENKLLVAGSKKYAKYSYDIFEMDARSELRRAQKEKSPVAGG